MKFAEQQKNDASGFIAELCNLSNDSQYLLPVLIISFALLGPVLLLRFPPEQYAFLYPQCPIHHYLGILCPGCGTTRALAALLRGHLLEALRLNMLTTISLPLITGWLLLAREPLRLRILPSKAIYTALAVSALFTVVRNL